MKRMLENLFVNANATQVRLWSVLVQSGHKFRFRNLLSFMTLPVLEGPYGDYMLEREEDLGALFG